MKREALTARDWLLGSVLLAGFVYSVFALTVNAKPAYAVSCNCTEEFQEAVQECGGVRNVVTFQCPATCGSGPCWSAQCYPARFILEDCSGT